MEKARTRFKYEHELMYVAIINALGKSNSKTYKYYDVFKNNDKKPKSVITADLYYPTPNESGFDLKEAVNPKDDLEEIMKAFDFYNDD